LTKQATGSAVKLSKSILGTMTAKSIPEPFTSHTAQQQSTRAIARTSTNDLATHDSLKASPAREHHDPPGKDSFNRQTVRPAAQTPVQAHRF
jgi:hypothetical protein